MRIEHAATISHPYDNVLAWHERPGALVRLTPPGMGTVDDPTASGFKPGHTVSITMGGAFLPGFARRKWTLEHGEVTRTDDSVHFQDHQKYGPFRQWRHEHCISADRGSDAPGNSSCATLRDKITADLPAGLGVAGDPIMGRTIKELLNFRAQQVRDDLDFHARYAAAPRLRVAVAGASGLVGTQVRALLTTGGHEVVQMVRGQSAGEGEIAWDPDEGYLDPSDLEGVDAVINLAGRSIATRFTDQAKREILQSRVKSSQLIAGTIAQMSDGPRVLVQASAIGAYGAQRPGEVLTEDDAFGEGFLAEVCEQWESSTRVAEDAGVRVAHVRTGIVLSDGGGALLPQLPMFFLGVGGRLSDPESMISWITLDDLVRIYVHALLTEDVAGPINAVAPEPSRNDDFATAVGEVMNRPSVVPVPSFGPRLVLGKEGASELVEADQNASAAKLLDSGFVPAHPRLHNALRHVLHRS